MKNRKKLTIFFALFVFIASTTVIIAIINHKASDTIISPYNTVGINNSGNEIRIPIDVQEC